ncbi:MAG: hypothetical protein WCO78_03400 [Candidatus Roizmanbacteria bacterium]
MTDLEKVQGTAWKLYRSLGKKKYFSPTLGTYVRFSNQGWRHLSNHARPTKRTLPDLIHRFSLLKLVPHVILSSKHATTHVQHNRVFHTLQLFIDQKLVRVILLEDFAGNIVFLSVIDKTQKKTAPHALSSKHCTVPPSMRRGE